MTIFRIGSIRKTLFQARAKQVNILKNKYFFFVFILSIFGLPSFAEAMKPSSPVQVMFHQEDLSEEEIKITFTLATKVDVGDVSISILLPPEVLLIEGEESWEGSLKAGKKKNLELVIQNAGDFASVIEGKVSVRLSSGAVFVQERRLILNRSKSKPPIPLPPLSQKGKNGGVLEFKGE